MEIPYRGEIERHPGGEFVTRALQRLFEEQQAQPLYLGGARIYTGRGTPLNVIVANIGDIYLRQLDGVVGATFYIKESDTGTALGWVAAGAATAPGTVIYTTLTTNVIHLNGAQLGLVEATAHGYNLA